MLFCVGEDKKKGEMMTERTYTEVRTEPRGMMRYDNDYAFVSPRVDIGESEDSYDLAIEMPGVPREGFRVKLESGDLVVEGRMQLTQPSELLFSEIPKRNYRRVFRLGRYADSERISARWDSGILYVSIAKKDEAKKHEIEITFV